MKVSREGGKEVIVGAFAGGGFWPRSAPVEDDDGGECDIEGGTDELGVVVVVDNECAEKVVRRRREGREGVAIYLVGEGGKEEVECFRGGERELERLGDDGRGATRDEVVREPCSVEGVSGFGGSSTVDVV